MKAFFVLIFASLSGIAFADYCDKDLCTVPPNPPTLPHIACGATGLPGPACPSDAENIEIDDEMKKYILDMHNNLRNKIASGNQPGFKPAKVMATMKWHDELAYFATLNALACKKHDICRNTQDFKFAGQNIGSQGGTAGFPTLKEAFTTKINNWYNENADATQSDINKYPYPSSKEIGHFTQVVNGLSEYVGCGAVKYTKSDGFKTIRLTCDYSRTNLGWQYIYEAGPAGSGCTTGTNPKYPALCSEKEPIDANSIHIVQ
jgi:Cysteine-rich secretory protein family